jgi:hypothetical protein
MIDFINMINQMEFNRKFDMGDLLTILTIIITLATLLYSLKKERELRRKVQADTVRTASAKTIAKLIRWRDLSLGMFQRFQPVFVDTSQKLAEGSNSKVIRDLLWAQLHKCRFKTSEMILQENIEIAYVDLYGYYPQIKPIIEELISRLKKEEDLMFNEFLLISQADTKYFLNRKEIESAELGNLLRKHARDVKARFQEKINKLIDPVSVLLYQVIIKNDKDILSLVNVDEHNLKEKIIDLLAPVNVDKHNLKEKKIEYPKDLELDPDTYKDILADAEEGAKGSVPAGILRRPKKP